MTERLSDEDLAALSKFGGEMDGIDELFGNTPGSCAAVGGLIARALAELRAHRQAALSGEDRRILGTLLVLLPGWLTHGEPRLSTPEQRAALSVLTRLVEAKP